MKKILLSLFMCVAVAGMANAQRVWAYDLGLTTESNGYTFTFTATTDAVSANLVFLNADGTEVGKVAVSAVAGVNTVTLTQDQIPGAGTLNWAVELSAGAISELVELTNAENEAYKYYLPQGVAVNANPESDYFGYTYVAAATDGAEDGGSDRADNQKRGIYVFDQELNDLNPDNVGILPANAAPLMTDVSRQAMHRVVVNPVNNHVVYCYNVEGSSAVWSMDPANLAGDAVNLIEGLAITKANAICFDAEGTLYVMDNANTADGGKLVKVVNGELVTIAQNGIWGVQDISLASDGKGGVWIAQNRWQVDAYAVLSHVNAAGEVDLAVTGSAAEELKALFPNGNGNASYRGQCAYNVEKDILAFGGNKVVTLFQVTYDAETGVPSLAKLAETEQIGGNIDGIAFYPNGDMAVASASSERFMKYAVDYGTPEVTTVELSYELTNDALLDRTGRRYVMAEDATLGSVQIIIPGFNAETAEYAEATLVVGDATLAATATYAADAENNTEVYTATATSEDGLTVYNVTMTVTLPTVQEYSFFAMDGAEAVSEDWGEDGENFMVYTVTGTGILDEESVAFELMIDQLNNIEGSINEVFVMGTATSLYVEEGNLAVSGTAQDEAGNTYNIEMWVALATPEVEIVITETVDVTIYNLNLEVMGNMAMVTAGGDALSFWMTLLETENHYGFYFSENFSNIWYGDAQLQAYGDGQYTPDGLTVAFISTPDAEGNAVQYNFTLIAGDEPVVEPEQVYTENKLNTYATGLTSVLDVENNLLTVTYVLNNSNATSVNVLVYNGAEVVATVEGTTAIGKNVVDVNTAELPTGVQLTWGVEVNGTSVEVPTREEKIYSFYHPSGLDIDNNPENPTFGLLLTNEGMHSVKTIDGYVSTGYGAGIYAFTPSFDPILNGDQPGYNGGIEFTNGRADNSAKTAYAPRRIRISEDGRIFVTSLNTDGNYLWEVNPANLNEWTSVLKGASLNEQAELLDADSNFIAAPNNGFDVKGAGENLQLAMYSVNLDGINAAAMGGFRLHEYNLGTATEWATAPSKALVEGKYAINYTGTQVEYDNEGGFWIASYRGTASDANPGLVHINAEGVEDAKLVWNNVRQAGIRFNNDFTKLVVAGNNGAAKKATIYAVSKDENGAPVLTEELVVDMAAVGNNLNDFAWDYAGNLYSCGNSAEKLAAWAMPYSGTVVTPAASQYAFELAAAPAVEMVGVVKRTLFNGYDVVVLTHEEDGTAHIYNIVEGDVLEVSQEGVIAVDPENAGDYLAISDIALTEDGKLVATNYMQTQAGDSYVNEGYKRGETRIYMWDDLAGAPSILFTSKMCSNWFRSKQGLTMAVKGTSDNMEIFMTGIHATSAWARVSSYRVIDGVYTEPEVNHNDYYYFYDVADAVALETTVGTQYELNASPLGDMNWILDANLIDPVEIVEPETNNVEIASCVALNEDLGKKYNGASYITVNGTAYMVAPFATPAGDLVAVEILDITNGLGAAQYVDMLYLDEAVAATAAATAVTVVENTLVISLVADATLYSFDLPLGNDGDDWQLYEDAITNLVIDYDNMLLIGGPSEAFQVEVVLGLGDYDRNTDNFALLPESSISVMGSEATFVEGYASVDGIAQTALAVVRCMWNGMALEFHLTMSAAALEATVVVVENAAIEIEKYLIWGDMYDYALKMTGNWINEEDGLTYPVLVEVPVYYPESTDAYEIYSTVTVGGWGDEDPWLGFGEGYLTITEVDNVITATGVVENPMAGVAIDITISGKLSQGPGTGVDNVQVEVKTVKVIKNGQLIINKDGVEYNVQGAVVK